MSDRTNYLLIWNPKRFLWEDLYDDWEAFNLGYERPFDWSCGNTRRIKVGDRIYLMRLGLEPKGICASGYVKSEPFSGFHWSEETERETALYIGINLDMLLNPDLQMALPR